MSNRDNFNQKLERIQQLSLEGQIPEARRELQKLCRRKIPREFAADVANEARVIDLPLKGVQLLHRYVRPPKGAIQTATAIERVVYAACLGELGAYREALEIFKELDFTKPGLERACFYRAICHIWAWDWEAALGDLRRLTRSKKRSNTLAANLWLGGALVHGAQNYQRARILLEEVARETAETNAWFLHKRALEFLIIDHFYQRDWKEALRKISMIEKINERENDFYYRLVARQWRCMVEIFNPKGGTATPEDVEHVRDEFLERDQWEEARGCDLYLALFRRDHDRLVHLYYGSPYPKLRERIAKALGGVDRIPPTYAWSPSGPGVFSHVLNVSTGENSLNSAYLKPGQLLQRMLVALSSDFYRPQQVTQLHEALYPGEYFNPESGPDRVHQVFLRLRDWFKEAALPLEVREKEGFYSLVSHGGLALLLSREAASGRQQEHIAEQAQLEHRLAPLRKHYRTGEFGANEAARVLNMSYRSAVSYLKKATESGLAERLGSGPATRYRFRAA